MERGRRPRPPSRARLSATAGAATAEGSFLASHLCKAGIRSAQAIKALQDSGFTGTQINLQGGILAWSNDVDPSVPKY